MEQPSSPYKFRKHHKNSSGVVGPDPRENTVANSHKKNLESGFRNLNSYAFALLSIQFLDPDLIRIQKYLRFVISINFFTDPDPRIRSESASHSGSFRKSLTTDLIKIKQIRVTFRVNLDFLDLWNFFTV
jgi:hypothetical protein